MSDLRATGRFLAKSASAIWIIVMVYQEFFIVDPSEFGFNNPEVQMRMAACSGDFLERYQCKDEIIIEKGREDFLVWGEKVAWIFAPPALLLALARLGRRRGDDDDFDEPNSPPPRDISQFRVK